MTELYINDNYIELDNQELLPTSQCGSIFSVEDIYSGITKQFSVPKTPNNRAALEGLDDINEITTVPYRRNTARLIVDGVELFFNAIALVESSGITYEIVVKYGNSDFFSLINSKLSELDLTELDHIWNLANVAASQDFTHSDGYTWQLIEFGLQQNQQRYNIRHALPSVFVRYLIEKIAAENGYSLEGDVWTSDEFSSDTIPLLTRNISDDVIENMQAQAFQDAYITLTGMATTSEIAFDDVIHDLYSLLIDNTRYKALTDCTVNVSAYISYTHVIVTSETPTLKIWLIKYKLDGTEEIIKENIINLNSGITHGTLTIDEDVVLSEYDTLGLKAELTAFSNSVQIGNPDLSTIWIQVSDAKTTAPGLGFPIASNLPDITQKDLFKAVAMKYGLIYSANNIDKVLRATQFEEISKRINTNDSYDYTDYLDLSDEEGIIQNIRTNYRSDVAQKNWFRFENDETVSNNYGDASFNVDDLTLEKSSNYIEFPFAATKIISKLGFPMPDIKLYTDYNGGLNTISNRWLQNYKQTGSTIQLISHSDMTTRLTTGGTILCISLLGATGQLSVDWDTDSETTIDNWLNEHKSTIEDIGITAYRVDGDKIRFLTYSFGKTFNGVSGSGGDIVLSTTGNSETSTHSGRASLATFTSGQTILTNYYSAQSRMFNYYKRLTLKLWLPVIEFANFDHFKPIYIEHLGWFYCEKINGFRTDSSTEFELVALDNIEFVESR